jgi:hypothetical protein
VHKGLIGILHENPDVVTGPNTSKNVLSSSTEMNADCVVDWGREHERKRCMERKRVVIINLGVVQAPQRQLVLLRLEHHLFAHFLDQRQRGSKVLQLFRPHAGLKVHRLVATAATAAATAAGHHPKCFETEEEDGDALHRPSATTGGG